MKRYQIALICLLLVLLSLWLRLPGLDRFLTPDEVVWANGAVQYLDAVRNRDWAATNLSGHPGVTTTWAGAVGLGAKWLFARPVAAASFSDYLAWVAADPIRPALLPWLRAPVAILCALGILALYLLARRLLDEKAALLAAALICLDPFLLAHGRVLQMDGLLATAICAAWLALLVAIRTGGRRFYVFSGLSIGFAVVTKSPALVMGPLMLGWIAWARWRSADPLSRRAGWIGLDLLWVGAPAVLMVILLWPALWVAPVETVRRVWGLMTVYGGGGHELGNYWLGKPVVQPGALFYPAVVALRTTPATLIGLLLLLIQGLARTFRTPNTENNKRALSTEDNKRVLSTETNKRAPSTENNKRVLSTENNTRAPSTENNKRAPSTENNKRAPSTENNKRVLSTENNTRVLSNQNSTRALSNQNSTRALSNQNSTRALSDQNSTRALSLSKGGRSAITSLLIFVLWFGLFLSIGAKKFDRYLLPIFPALDLLAAWGWMGVIYWIMDGAAVGRWRGKPQRAQRAQRVRRGQTPRVAGAIVMVLLVGLQGWMALAHRPSYLAAYNPLVGGVRRAAHTMLVGWGEGMAEAAGYLNALPGAADAHTAAWYGNNVFGAFYAGQSFDLYYDTPAAEDLYRQDIDYVVTYVNQVQRDMVAPSVRVRLSAPLHTVSVGDFTGAADAPWAQVYAWPKPFAHTTDRVIAEGLWLRGWQVGDRGEDKKLATGQIPVTLFWDAAELAVSPDIQFLIWLKDAAGEVWATAEEPVTSNSPREDGWGDRPVVRSVFFLQPPVGLAPGPYRVEMAPFAGQSAVLTELDIPVTRLPDKWESDADVLSLGSDVQRTTRDVRFGDEVQLAGHALVRTGEKWTLDLLWASLAVSDLPRNFFVHLVDQTGEIVGQADGPLVRLDAAGELVRQRVRVALPEGADTAGYRLYVGVYQPLDGTRLTLTVDGESAPDGRYLLTTGQ